MTAPAVPPQGADPAPDLLDRLAGGDPAAPALMTAEDVLSRAALRARVAGAAAPGPAVRVAGRAAAAWLPWLAGCLWAGRTIRFDADGTDAPPPTAGTWPAPAPATTPCLHVATSGSTGGPRVLARDRAGWVRCFAAEAAHLDLTPADRVLTLGAPAFSLTPYAALRALHLGAPVGVLGQVAAAPARALLDALRPTVVYGVPPLVMALARAARRADWHGVRRVITGGARLTPAQHTAIAEAWPAARVATFYGAAETSFIAMNRAPDPTRPDDMGPLFPGVSVVAADDTGLRVRTPYAARQTMIDAGTPQPLADADGAVALADRVHLEGDRVVLRGRADDVLNLGGALIDPGPVERAVEALPWVAEAALVPVPDARRSATAGLVAVPVGAPPAAAAAELRAAMPSGAEVRPRHVAVIAEPPRTPGGKLDRRALTARLARAASA